MTDADVRRILAIPDGVDTVEHLQRVARALADALSPLAPWPPGWIVVPEEGIVAYQWQEDGTCVAYVTPGEDRAWWTIVVPGDDRAWWILQTEGDVDDVGGPAPDVLAAISECMAVLAARRSA